MLGAMLTRRPFTARTRATPDACALAAGVFAFAVTLLAAPSAHAAGPWVERHLTLPARDWSFDFGLGLAHAPRPDLTGAGMNLEFAVAPTRHLEIGLRSGGRIGDDG